MKKVVTILAVAGAIVLLATLSKEPEPQVVRTSYSDGFVKIASREISLDFALTTDEQRQGLSGRVGIEENQGMLFIFQVPDFLVFWMKDMNFPIDIVWIKDDEVVDISAQVQPEPGVADAELKTYTPKVPADKVLELKAGWAERNGLKVGDKLEITRVIQ